MTNNPSVSFAGEERPEPGASGDHNRRDFPCDMVPTDQQVNGYRARGWYISSQILGGDEIELALEGMREYHAGVRDTRLHYQIKEFLDWTPQSPYSLRVNDFAALQSRKIAAVALKPVIGQIAARLAGSKGVRLFSSSMVYKPADPDQPDTRIGWHADRAYWQTCSSTEMLTAWIPLHDITADCGPLTVLDGSNTWPDSPGVTELRTTKSFISSDHDSLDARIRRTGRRFEPVPLLMRRGQVSFHHSATMHGSGLNTSGRPRMNLIVHMQDLSNRHVERYAPNGERYTHSIDQLVRTDAAGQPDYTDPAICPVIWQEEDTA
jgi:phytanoyl-CoA dioxygenase PhyH